MSKKTSNTEAAEWAIQTGNALGQFPLASAAAQSAQDGPKAAPSKKGASQKKGAPKGQRAAKGGKPKAAPKKQASKKAAKPALKEARKPRAESKTAKILDLIRRPKGATLAEIMKAAGWQAHSVRGFISTAGKKHNVTIESSKNEAGERTYRIAK